MIVYLDESGDLGFSEASSNHFIIGFLATETEVTLKRRVKRVKEQFGLGPKIEAKASDSSPDLRRAMLRAVRASGAEIHAITVFKAHVHKRLREKWIRGSPMASRRRTS
ncbi:MAG: DUF3800 domain-containing protein [candidate division NC10 bacterium]|nr:DUF3800 domain-containing protein [candidate division NC10 bacterium]